MNRYLYHPGINAVKITRGMNAAVRWRRQPLGICGMNAAVRSYSTT
jgi:hypothetical protein